MIIAGSRWLDNVNEINPLNKIKSKYIKIDFLPRQTNPTHEIDDERSPTQPLFSIPRTNAKIIIGGSVASKPPFPTLRKHHHRASERSERPRRGKTLSKARQN